MEIALQKAGSGTPGKGIPKTPLERRPHDMERRPLEKEAVPHMHFIIPQEGAGRGRSESFSSQSSRESSPSSLGRGSTRSSGDSFPDLRPGEHPVPPQVLSVRQRRFSKGSCGSSDSNVLKLVVFKENINTWH